MPRIRLRIGSLRFAPNWIPTLATLAILPILLHLGFWQLDRGEQKEALIDLNQRNAAVAAKSVERLGLFAEQQRYLLVEARGRYLAERQFLLDNRTHKGAAGYHVITPMHLQSGAVVLVNRGWVPVGPSRANLPDLTVEVAPRIVRGEVRPVETPGLLLGAAGYATDRWPRVVQRLDLAAIGALLKVPVLEQLVALDADEPEGYVRDWRAHHGITPERHRGYAVQWFALALTLTLIYLVVNTRKDLDHT